MLLLLLFNTTRAHTPDPQARGPRSLWTEVWPTQFALRVLGISTGAARPSQNHTAQAPVVRITRVQKAVLLNDRKVLATAAAPKIVEGSGFG